MKQDFARYHETCAIRGFDVLHQLGRLRLSKNVPDVEMEAIARAIAENLKSYEQVVEVSDLACPFVIALVIIPPAAGSLVTSRGRALVPQLGVAPSTRIHPRSHCRYSQRTPLSFGESSPDYLSYRVLRCRQGRSDVSPGLEPLFAIRIC
jgi:hypothetical protein